MLYQPIGNGVLIQELPMDSASKGGILLPPQAQGRIRKAQVIAVGPGVPDRPVEVKPGDVILYYDKQSLDIDEFKLIAESGIYVKIVDDGIDHRVQPQPKNSNGPESLN